MNRKARTFFAMAAIAAVMALAPLAAVADTRIVEVTTSGNTETRSETWLGEDRMATLSEDGDMIYRGDLDKLYMVRHGEKVVYAVDLPFDISSILPPQMAEMMAQMVPQVSVTPTDETRTIAGYEARQYNVDITLPMGAKSEMKLFASKDVPIDWERYRAMYDDVTASLQPQMRAVFEELSAVEGFHLGNESVQSAMGQTMTVTKMTESIEEKAAPEGIYEPPADYQQKPFDMQALMGMQQGG